MDLESECTRGFACYYLLFHSPRLMVGLVSIRLNLFDVRPAEWFTFVAKINPKKSATIKRGELMVDFPVGGGFP